MLVIVIVIAAFASGGTASVPSASAPPHCAPIGVICGRPASSSVSSAPSCKTGTGLVVRFALPPKIVLPKLRAAGALFGVARNAQRYVPELDRAGRAALRADRVGIQRRSLAARDGSRLVHTATSASVRRAQAPPSGEASCSRPAAPRAASPILAPRVSTRLRHSSFRGAGQRDADLAGCRNVAELVR